MVRQVTAEAIVQYLTQHATRNTEQKNKDMKNILIILLVIVGLVANASASPLYETNFEKAEVGKVPDDLMVLGGEFAVKADGTNKVLELPGAPLDSFAVQFGPSEKENIVVSAKIFGTSKGRRAPTFGVGLGGVSGWKLQVSPGKKAVELLRDAEVKAAGLDAVGFADGEGGEAAFQAWVVEKRDAHSRVGRERSGGQQPLDGG